jgi:DNA gyrase/topoisomerase IV subunit B
MSDKIQKLSDYQHARLRTEMYLGSRDPHTQVVLVYPDGKPELKEVTWVPAVFTAFREILDNALDEVAGHGHGDRIDVTYDPTSMTFSVEDNGRGIPIDYSDEHQTYMATLALSHARAGRNFAERGQVAGTNGIGASVVNFCSEYFILDIERDGKSFKQKFTQGDDDLVINDPVIKTRASAKSGTKVEFRLSPKVFKDRTLPEEFLRSRIYEVAICNPKIKVYYNGERIIAKSVEKNLFTGLKPIHIEVVEGTFKSNFWLLPGFFESGEHQHSLVNNIPAFDGGVHMDAFKRHFFGGLLLALERESKKRKLQPNRSDLAEGLMIFNITTMKAPNFNSQSKTRLNNEETAKFIKATLDDPDFFKNIIKKYGDWIDDIYQRCADRTMKRDASDADKEAKKMLREKVPGLMDATGVDRSKCILFLAEGLSAISGMASVRNPEIHGGLGLQGKVMNVHGASIKDVLDDSALRDIMNSIGISPTQKLNRHTMRYGKIYVAHDMDPDGLNIGALLNNFFYTYWPEMFDADKEPIVHVFMTPFIIAEKGKQRKYWYSDNYMEFEPEQYKGWSITRAKGLGTLTTEDWNHSLVQPKLFPLVDDGMMKETLDLIFNPKRANDRKVWIGL